MPEEKKDWNAYFKEQYAAQQRDKAQKLKQAKAAAKGTPKEPFNAKRFEALYRRLAPYSVSEYTSWESLIKESEYDYYVMHKDIMTLEELVKHLEWMDGFA